METELMKIISMFFSLVFGMSIVSAVSANTIEANNAGKEFAQSINDMKVKDMGKHIDPKEIPNFQGNDVPETSYYTSGLNIKEQAKNEAETNPNALYIQNAREKRNKISIDPKN